MTVESEIKVTRGENVVVGGGARTVSFAVGGASVVATRAGGLPAYSVSDSP